MAVCGGRIDWAPGPCDHRYAALRCSASKLPLQMLCFSFWWESFSTKENPGFALRFKPCSFCTTHTQLCLSYLFMFDKK